MRPDSKPERIEYRIRATGPLAGATDNYGPIPEVSPRGEKATERYAKFLEDEADVVERCPALAGKRPWVLEARYVGPWEAPDDARLRREVLDDNLERAEV